jgi:hypothetical protein
VIDPDHSKLTDANLSRGGNLVRMVDLAGVEHLGYQTARRTLCLERLIAECSPKQPATAGTCTACTQVRRRISRTGSRA